MSFVDANGVRLHVQSMGPTRSTDTEPPVFLLHGLLLGNLVGWYFTLAPALAKSRRVLMYDLRGHGKSEAPPEGYDLDTMAADLGGLIDHFEPEGRPVDLVGHSWGALVAMTYALYHPNRVRRLVVIEAPLPPSNFEEMQSFMSLSPKEMMEKLPKTSARNLISGGRQALRLLSSLVRLVRKTSCVADFKNARDIPDALLACLGRPVLTLYGNRSPCRAVGDRLARVLPQCQLRELAGGHNLHMEATQALIDEITEFFDDGMEHPRIEPACAVSGR